MIWLLSFVLGAFIGLNSSAFLVIVVAGLLGLAIVAQAVLTGIGLLDIPGEIVLSAIAFNLGLVVGLATSFLVRRH